MPNSMIAHELFQSAQAAAVTVWAMTKQIRRDSIFVVLLLAAVSCTSTDIAATTLATPGPTPIFFPYPDDLDVAVFRDEMTFRINDVRAEQGKPSLLWDDTLQDLADWQTLGVVRGAPYGRLGDSVADQLGEPVAQLWTCMEGSVTTAEDIAQRALEQWLRDPGLWDILLDHWQRVGVGFDWGCPDPQGGGAVVVVILAGRPDLRDG